MTISPPSQRTRSSLTVLGLDPGLERTGFGVLRVEPHTVTVVHYGRIETSRNHALPYRLLALSTAVRKLCRRFRPDIAAVEELFFARNVKTAMIVGQARGSILLACAAAKTPVRGFTPTAVKQALTGYGGADKNQVQRMLAHILHLELSSKEDDAADALAVAWCCAQTERVQSKHP